MSRFKKPLFMKANEFWAKVERTETCWIWKGSKCGGSGKPGGMYGTTFYDGKRRLAHHMAWFITHGEWIPKDKVLMHTCDTPTCVNPDHLKLGTRSENSRDMVAKNRATRGKPGAKLTREQVLAIRRLAKTGVSQNDLALLAGVSQPQINSIVNAKSWSDV